MNIHSIKHLLSLKHIAWILIVICVFSVSFMLLWNLIIPDIFGIKTINFWQAAGLLLLSRLLFGGMGRIQMKRDHEFHHNLIHDKWMKMNPDERRAFMRERHHHYYDTDSLNKNDGQSNTRES